MKVVCLVEVVNSCMSQIMKLEFCLVGVIESDKDEKIGGMEEIMWCLVHKF